MTLPVPDPRRPREAAPVRRRPVPGLRARRLVLGVLGGCVLATAGCGDDTGADRERFVAAADVICEQANRVAEDFAGRIAHAQRGSDPARVYRDLAALTRRRAAAAQRALGRLDALEVPDADRDRLKSWIADQRRRQTLVLRLAAAFTRRDDAVISTLSQRIDALNSGSRAFAARYGLQACARTVA